MRRSAPIPIVLGLAAIAVLAASAKASAQHMQCAIVDAVGPSFGRYDPLRGEPVDSAGYVAFRCDGVGPSDMVVIELGRGHGPSYLSRYMSRRNERLEYNLFLDAARTLIWGDGTRGTSRYHARPPDGRTVSVPLYGRILPRQTVSPGAYSDQVVLTVQY